MKSAMRSGDKQRLATIRLILAAIKQVEVDTRKELSDADVIGILDKMVKQRLLRKHLVERRPLVFLLTQIPQSFGPY